MLRRFYLERKEDVSGVSGTGRVAEGAEFDNGMCALSFLSQYHHINVYTSMRELKKVHGHEGKTVVIYIDSEEEEYACCVPGPRP